MKQYHVIYIPHKKTLWENWYREQTHIYAANIEAARRKIREFGEVHYISEVK